MLLVFENKFLRCYNNGQSENSGNHLQLLSVFIVISIVDRVFQVPRVIVNFSEHFFFNRCI